MAEVRARRQAFAEYVLPEVDLLYRVARSLTGQPADAEDLVQDTLLRAFRAIDRFDGQHPRAWLLTILRNAEHNRHRRMRPDLLRDPDETMDRLGAVRDPAPTPEQVVVDARFDAEVEAAFSALPGKHQQVVALVDMQGLGYADAAAVLGIPVGTVMSRLHRARKQIRRHLRDAGVAVERGEQ